MVKVIHNIVTALILSCASSMAISNEVIKSETTITPKQVIRIEATIVGSKEQPKFLTIVPWRTLQAPKVNNEKQMKLVPKEITSIEPNELKAQLNYK